MILTKLKMMTNNAPSHIGCILLRTAVAVATLAAGICLFACTQTDQQPAGALDKVTIAYSATQNSALVGIAQKQGYYRQEGLEAVSHSHPYGKLALQEVLEGKADFATVAETPLVFEIMRGEKIAIIATIQIANNNNAILARKDRGIIDPGDLKGRKIGVTSETVSDFFLHAFLSVHGISRGQVTLVDLKQGEMEDALLKGNLDAVSAFQPYLSQIKKKLDERGTTFYENELYMMTFNIVAKQEYVLKHPEAVKKLLRALLRAAEFTRQHPDEAQTIVADFCRMDVASVREIWPDNVFTVTLDQSLVLAMEDESDWAIKNKLTENTEIPNYLDYIYFDGLMAVKPEAVRILR